MLCSNCLKLAFMSTNKKCVRCQGALFNNISVLCDNCSETHKQCSVCLKKIVSQEERNKNRGCGCSGRK